MPGFVQRLGDAQARVEVEVHLARLLALAQRAVVENDLRRERLSAAHGRVGVDRAPRGFHRRPPVLPVLHASEMPPSTAQVWPVTKAVLRDASSTTAFATSSAVAMRPSGIAAFLPGS